MFSIFHALFYDACKAWWIQVSNIERNAVLIKERCCLCIQFFGSWLQQYYRRFNWLFWGRYKKLVHHLLFPCFAEFACYTHHFTDSFLGSSESVIVFVVNSNTWTYSSFFLGQDKTWIHWSFCHKKCMSQNMHTAFLVQPFLASVLFVNAKYCQTKCSTLFFSGCSRFSLLMSS